MPQASFRYLIKFRALAIILTARKIASPIDINETYLLINILSIATKFFQDMNPSSKFRLDMRVERFEYEE